VLTMVRRGDPRVRRVFSRYEQDKDVYLMIENLTKCYSEKEEDGDDGADEVDEVGMSCDDATNLQKNVIVI